jgi:hypothetical protein
MTSHQTHRPTPRPLLPSPQHLLCAIALLGAGLFIGSTVNVPSAAWGQITKTPQQPHMLSGGQLSLPILQDMSNTLEQIDARLARMESLAKQMSTRRASAGGQ